MLGADGDGDLAVLVGADALDIAEGAAGHDEAAVLHVSLFDLFAALGQTVAVDRDEREHVAADLKERAGVDRARVGGRDGENGLVDHAAQDALGNGDVVHAVHDRHFGEVRRGDADKVELAAAALDRDVEIGVGRDRDDAVRQTAQHLAEKARADDDRALFGDVRLDAGVDALAQVIARDGQPQVGLQQKSLQCGDRALGGGGARSNGAGRLDQVFFT